MNGKASGEKSRFKTLRACFGWGKDREGNLLKTFLFFRKRASQKQKGIRTARVGVFSFVDIAGYLVK